MSGKEEAAAKNWVDPGRALRAARQERGWTLADLSRKTGYSISTLSKIENGKSGLSYTKLMKLGQNMGVDIAELLSETRRPVTPGGSLNGRIARGARALTRAGAASVVEDEAYIYFCHAADLLRRGLHPMVIEVKARAVDEFTELRSHPGEEFTYVLEGVVDLYTDQYAPMRMEAGDSIYFDPGMGHAWVAVSEDRCRIISIFSELSAPAEA